MDGKGSALDNVFVERLWKTVKYENIYLNEYQTAKDCKQGLARYFEMYNNRQDQYHAGAEFEEMFKTAGVKLEFVYDETQEYPDQ